MVQLVPQVVSPSAGEAALARESGRRLAGVKGRKISVVAAGNGDATPIELPAAAVELLLKVLTEMGAGNAVTLIPVHAELTTQQAAELLGVSRPFLIKLLDAGAIPYRRVGTHRRILFSDLVAYREHAKREQDAARDELAEEAQRLGLGY
jgi:excisionase family DNA binding protein